MAYTIGSNYHFVSHRGTGLCLNRSGTGAIANNQNVNVYTWTEDADEKWKLVAVTGGCQIQSMMNNAYGLDIYRGSANLNNCDVYTVSGNGPDALMDLITVDAANNLYKLKSITHNLYLTAGTAVNSDVRFAASNSADSQVWKLTTTNPSSGGGNGTLTVGTRPSTLNYSSTNYSSTGGNPFDAGQCTWHAWGRAKEVMGKSIIFSATSGRHAKFWPSLVTNCTLRTTVVANSIAVWDDGGAYGHVGYIEKVDGNNIYLTEANWDTANNAVDAEDGKVKIITTTAITARGNNNQFILKGYLAL